LEKNSQKIFRKISERFQKKIYIKNPEKISVKIF
jgi:hypothetical protein